MAKLLGMGIFHKRKRPNDPGAARNAVLKDEPELTRAAKDRPRPRVTTLSEDDRLGGL